MEMEVDGEGEFLAAAREDDIMVAQLLMRLSRSTTCVPWYHLPESKPPTEDGPAPPLLPPTWGRRRARSGALVAAEGAKREEEAAAGGASPATPLSWSGASGTSGSGSDDVWSAPPRPPKRRGGVHERGELEQPPRPASTDGAEVCRGAGEQIGAPAAKGTTPELSRGGGPAPNWAKVGSSDEGGEPHGDSLVGATPAVGSSAAGSGSSKATAVAPAATRVLGPTGSIAHAEPLRSRLTAEGANSVVFRRQGKKKTILELRAMKHDLLREQEQLQKEFGKQREMYGALLEENMALKKLEVQSTLPSLMVSKPYVALACGEAELEQPHHMQSASEWQAPNGVGTAYVVNEVDCPEQPQCTRSSPSVPAPTCLFDLNFLPDGDL